MKRLTKQLLDDLLEDSASPEFHAVLMDKTLRSARQRKRVRHFSLALGIIVFAGIFAFAFQEMRQPAISLTQILQIRQPVVSATPAPPLNPVQVVSTKRDSTLAVVQTSEADRPKEINDKELLTLLAGKSVALVRYAPNRTELISFGGNN
ncbi:MAG TPA: hypothetical protein VHY30_02495 [Verrucomicrobiae bacterium]|jgi:hypothetical protein|nr:hypothetical protein [Verrucomicrobiae bacterium]